jgi:hypothetical protein
MELAYLMLHEGSCSSAGLQCMHHHASCQCYLLVSNLAELALKVHYLFHESQDIRSSRSSLHNLYRGKVSFDCFQAAT